MQRILFLRDFRPTKDGRPRISGGHLKVRDYFMHALAHPQLEPSLYFTPRSRFEESELWEDIPRERVVREVEPGAFDLAFVTGKDWKLVPSRSDDRSIDRGTTVIHYVQSLEQCEPAHPLFSLLARPALRICVSDAVDAASAPHRRGRVTVIPCGIPLDLFKPQAKRSGSVVLWGWKNKALATALNEELSSRGIEALLLTDYLPREEFAEVLGKADIFVGMPKPREGFFLPAIEAMASGCLVVCPDAEGNRAYCIQEETCLMPRPGDATSYIACIERLREGGRFAESLRKQAIAKSEEFSLEAERLAFYRLLEETVLKHPNVHRRVS